MKIVLTRQELYQVETGALQKLVTDHIQNLVEARAEEIRRELGDTETSLKELHLKYLSKPVIDTTSTTNTLLVPSGIKMDEVKR